MSIIHIFYPVPVRNNLKSQEVQQPFFIVAVPLNISMLYVCLTPSSFLFLLPSISFSEMIPSFIGINKSPVSESAASLESQMILDALGRISLMSDRRCSALRYCETLFNTNPERILRQQLKGFSICPHATLIRKTDLPVRVGIFRTGCVHNL